MVAIYLIGLVALLTAVSIFGNKNEYYERHNGGGYHTPRQKRYHTKYDQYDDHRNSDAYHYQHQKTQSSLIDLLVLLLVILGVVVYLYFLPK